MVGLYELEPEPDLGLVPVLRVDNVASNGTEQVAIVDAGCDLYVYARDTPELIAPHLVPVGILLRDVYGLSFADWPCGERRALQECVKRFGIEFETWFSYNVDSLAFPFHVPAIAMSAHRL